MRWYQLDLMGDYGETYCYSSDNMDGFGLGIFDFSRGTRSTEYIAPGTTGSISLTADDIGIKKGAILGNRSNHLYCRGDFKRYLENVMLDYEVEYYRFDLISHKKTVHSDDYWVVNPIGIFDCMNYEKSEIEYGYDNTKKCDVVIGVDTYFLCSEKLKSVPPLFRLKEVPRIIIVNETIANDVEKFGFDNIDLIEFDVV